MSGVSSFIASVQPAVPAVAALALSLAALHDVAVRTIPTIPLIAVLALGVASRLADHDMAAAALSSASVFVLGALCWRFGWLGGGDVKLLAACALLAPPGSVPKLLLLTAIAGGILACLYLVLGLLARGLYAPRSDVRPRSFLLRVVRTELWRIKRLGSLPYGCAISAATLITLCSR
jgi:prepilin peptidase CpaA